MAARRFSIRMKLTTLVALFAIPIVWLAGLFALQADKDIHFAAQERQGVRYLSAIWPALQQLTRNADDGARPDGAAIVKAAAALDTGMSTATQSHDLLESLAAPHADRADIAAARALIGRVGDKSNLILDPDLDSYYVMDVVLLRLPETVDVAEQARDLTSQIKAAGSVTEDQSLDFAILLGKLAGTAEGASASLASAIDGNHDGGVKTALQPSFDAWQAAFGTYQTALRQAALKFRAEGGAAGLDLAGIDKARADLVDASDAFWRAGAKELDRLLAKRIAGFQTNFVWRLAIAAAVTLLAFFVAFSLLQSVIGAIRTLDGDIRRLADQDLDAELAQARDKDEIAHIAQAVDYFRTKTIEKIAAANSDERKRELLLGERRAMTGVADKIRASVGEIVAALGKLSKAMEDASREVASASEHTRRGAGDASAMLETASRDLSGVVGGVDQLSHSISEISRQAEHAAANAGTALGQAQAAAGVGTRLEESSRRIGEITQVIAGIAEQTNLLALNATIESARAGDAGKGFAVVAQEVKALAGQTGAATDEIARQINDIQAAVKDVLASFRSVAAIIEGMSGVTASIASAVEEQNVATRGISDSLSRANAGAGAAIGRVEGLPALAQRTEKSATGLADFAIGISGEVSRLKGEIERLLTELTDRRIADRYPADSPVRIYDGAAERGSRLLDISEFGGRLALVDGVQRGAHIHIIFADGARLPAEVAWATKTEFGVSFNPAQLERGRFDQLAKRPARAAA